MAMLCQRCNAQPATIQITDIVQKKLRMTHICEGCARAAGLIAETEDAGPQLNLQTLVKIVFGQTESDEPVGLNCPHCGLKYPEFRAEGRMGCAHDYDIFCAPLIPLLERIHRHRKHVGKVPTSAGAAEVIRAYRAQLKLAIQAEDYEQAAILRDRIRGKEAHDESE
ncbi:MAG: UvrB/UvrC motif-containing protein [Fimbriiglobus sp.]